MIDDPQTPLQIRDASNNSRTGGQAAAGAALLGGTPLAILSVLLWKSYHPGMELDEISACAVGSVGASIFAYCWHAITRVIDHFLNKL